jgi:hypothetical protein
MATCTSGARCSSAAAMVAAAGLGVSREKGQRGGFYSRARVVRRCATDRLTPRHGMGRGMAQTGPRRAAALWPMESSGQRARPVGERHVDCPGSPLTSCKRANTRGARTLGRGPASSCVYGEVRWRPSCADDAARAMSRARARLIPIEFQLALFEQSKLSISLQKWTKS